MKDILSFIDPEIAKLIVEEQMKLKTREEWFQRFRSHLDELPRLSGGVWKENSLIQDIPDKFSKFSKIAAVDGGLIQTELRGFDLVLTRAVAPIFRGLGSQVKVDYVPEFNPKPAMTIFPPFETRQELGKVATLLRLKSEYEVAFQTIELQKPKILLLDGAVYPLKGDFGGEPTNEVIQDLEAGVQRAYINLIKKAISNEALVLGVVKDSRSRSLTTNLISTIVDWIRTKKISTELTKGFRMALTDLLDTELTAHLLKLGQRMTWFQLTTPSWFPLKPRVDFRASYLKTVLHDLPIRVEVAYPLNEDWAENTLNHALGSLRLMTQHGLDTALPSILIEADERARIKQETADFIIEQLALLLGVPVTFLRKRRHYPIGFD